MTTALVISRAFPSDDQMVHGVYQRLGTQISALAKIVDRVECLFLVTERTRLSREEIEEHRRRLGRRWGADISLTIAPVVRAVKLTTRWQLYGRAVFDFHAHSIARDVRNGNALAAVIEALQRRPDIILAHRLSAMCVLMRARRHMGDTPILFDLDDIEHIAFSRRLVSHAEWRSERLMLLQVPRLLLGEIRAILLSRATFVCSNSDRRYLGRFVGSRRLKVVPNSIPFPVDVSSTPTSPLVLFVGSMSYPPNALAADSLVRDIWPIVRDRVPGAQLVIAGSNPEQARTYPASDPSVRFLGFVDSLDEVYASARVVCCPIRYGAGTRIKIIEAAAYGKAVVSTPLGAEGLDFEDGREIVLREDSHAIAEECAHLLQDIPRAQALGLAAREKARRVYDRDAVNVLLERLFGETLRSQSAMSVQGSATQRV